MALFPKRSPTLFDPASNKPILPTSPEYRRFIQELKQRIVSTRISAARAVNRDIIFLYWDIGQGIVEKQQVLGWGDSVVEMVAADLQRVFPGVTGFSPQNMWRMLQFYKTHTQEEFLSQVVRELKKHGKKVPAKRNLSQVVREIVCAIPWWGHHYNLFKCS